MYWCVIGVGCMIGVGMLVYGFGFMGLRVYGFVYVLCGWRKCIGV